MKSLYECQEYKILDSLGDSAEIHSRMPDFFQRQDMLAAVDGVQFIFGAHKHQVNVHKSAAFTWDEVIANLRRDVLDPIHHVNLKEPPA